MLRSDACLRNLWQWEVVHRGRRGWTRVRAKHADPDYANLHAAPTCCPYMVPCLLSPLEWLLAFPGETACGRSCEAAAPLRVAVDVGHSPRRSARPARPGDASTISTCELRKSCSRPIATLSLFRFDGPGARLGLRSSVDGVHRKAEIFLSIQHDSVNNKYMENIWNIGLVMDVHCNSPVYTGDFPCSFSAAARIASKILNLPPE